MILAFVALAFSPAAAAQSQPDKPNKSEAATVEGKFTGAPIAGIDFGKTEAPREVAEAARPFLGKPITRETLAELVGALTGAYETSRIALYTVAIPDQDFAEGVVRVTLAEAGVEDVVVEDGERFPLLSRMAGKLNGLSPLPRPIYERQLSLMKSLPGTTFDLKAANPDHDGEVLLTFVPKRKSVEAALGVGNRGPDLLGDFVGNARLDFNTLLFSGDRLRFTAAATPRIGRFRQFGATYQAPVGASGLTATSSLSLIHTRAKDFDLEGRARVAQFSLSYPLVRTFRRSADVGLMLDGVNSTNALFGNVLSSDRVRTLRGFASYASASPKDKLQAQIIASQGLNILGARVNPILSERSFLKASAAVSYEREVSAHLFGRATVLGQYSRDRLPASELFTVGGEPVGRAFDTALLSGDRGVGAVGELAFQPISSGSFAKSEVYAYADAAVVAFEGRAGFPTRSYDLASAGVGARAKWKEKIELGVEAGRVLNDPYPGYAKNWRLSFNYRLTL